MCIPEVNSFIFSLNRSKLVTNMDFVLVLLFSYPSIPNDCCEYNVLTKIKIYFDVQKIYDL